MLSFVRHRAHDVNGPSNVRRASQDASHPSHFLTALIVDCAACARCELLVPANSRYIPRAKFRTSLVGRWVYQGFSLRRYRNCVLGFRGFLAACLHRMTLSPAIHVNAVVRPENMAGIQFAYLLISSAAAFILYYRDFYLHYPFRLPLDQILTTCQNETMMRELSMTGGVPLRPAPISAFASASNNSTANYQQ